MAGYSGPLRLMDVGALVADLATFVFVPDAAGGTVNVSGYFVDMTGARAGNAFTAAMVEDGATTWTFASMYGAPLPVGTVGFVGSFDAAVRFDQVGPNTAATTLAGSKTSYPLAVASQLVTWGRVANRT